MDEEVLIALRSPTTELKLQDFQVTLNFAQKIKNISNNEDIRSFVMQVTEILWMHANSTLPTLECQLMCATSFFTVLIYHENPTAYIENIKHDITNYYSAKINEEIKHKEPLIITSLIYGLFQSHFLSSIEANEMIVQIIEDSFKVLILSAYDYSSLTFITFKTLQSLRKLLNTKFKHILLDPERCISLLKVTSHNWENPITGVRDLNKMIFRLYLDISVYEEDFKYEQLITEINNFPWNKAKYLMLSEIIEKEAKSSMTLLQANTEWMNGLLKSLTTSSLVSAGADMYFSLLKKTHSGDEWCKVFLKHVLSVLTGQNYKMIENFNNYWSMNTFKQFPVVLNVLIESILNLENEITLYAYTSILRQGNKIGILKKNWLKINKMKKEKSFPIDECFLKFISQGLEHINVNIRIQTFEIVCISHCNTFPTDEEFKLIMKFLKDNVNSDATILRLSMLNNLKLFFSRLLTSTANLVKYSRDSTQLRILLEFSVSLQTFLKEQLTMQGNYQRNIACIGICRIFLSLYGNPLQRKRKQKSSTDNEFTLKKWLEENGKWLLDDECFIECLLKYLNNPAEDVRESICQIMIENYAKNHAFLQRLNNILETSLKYLQSKFFYEVSSGHCGIKLVTSLLAKKKYNDLKFKSIEDLFQHFYEKFVFEVENKTDILTSIETGKPLHSLICVLHNILEVCLASSYPVDNVLNVSRKRGLIEKLQEVPKMYSLEEGGMCSPDFAELSDMLEQLIFKSSIKMTVEESDVKLSDVHQIVLNCVWLNLKASCDLGCALLRCTDDVSECGECLHIVTNVLETSRHKGAIEAAGIALGKSIKHLTASENAAVSCLPMILLEEKLDELTLENGTRSITRRGAGLSIMLHRIVSNDMKREKPLFHYAITRLLEASKANDVSSVMDNGNEKDIPKAIYIHLMTKIVADSSLASDVMFYSASLAEVAFTNLTSDQWQIRNASLQLYGSLVPKLIGQKKASGSNEDTAATVGCVELRMHSPKLWKYIMQQIDSHNNHKDIIISHSDLVPILNILASTAKMYNFSIDSLEHKGSDEILFQNLMKLLGSPIFTARRLTAKSIELMYNVENIVEYILKTEKVSENMLHGYLMLVKFCMKNRIYKSKQPEIQKYFETILKEKHSYVSRSVYDEIFIVHENLLEKVKITIDILNKNEHTPGSYLWANTVIETCVKNCESMDIASIIKLLTNTNDFEMYSGFILDRVKCGIAEEDFKEIAAELLANNKKFECNSTWKLLFEISILSDVIFDPIVVNEICNNFCKHNWTVSYKNRFAIPFLAKIISSGAQCDVDCLDKFSNLVLSLTNYEVDVDMRYITAKANNFLGVCIAKLTQYARENIITSAVNMLQDDDENVRVECAKFYSFVNKASFVYQPFICLNMILDCEFLKKTLGDNMIQYVNKLEMANCAYKNAERGYNPFVLETRNIYAEPKVFQALINKVKSHKDFVTVKK